MPTKDKDDTHTSVGTPIKGHQDPALPTSQGKYANKDNMLDFKAKYIGEFEGKRLFEFDYNEQEDVQGSIPNEAFPDDFTFPPEGAVSTLTLPNNVVTDMLISTDAYKNEKFPPVEHQEQEGEETETGEPVEK